MRHSGLSGPERAGSDSAGCSQRQCRILRTAASSKNGRGTWSAEPRAYMDTRLAVPVFPGTHRRAQDTARPRDRACMRARHKYPKTSQTLGSALAPLPAPLLRSSAPTQLCALLATLSTSSVLLGRPRRRDSSAQRNFRVRLDDRRAEFPVEQFRIVGCAAVRAVIAGTQLTAGERFLRRKQNA